MVLIVLNNPSSLPSFFLFPLGCSCCTRTQFHLPVLLFHFVRSSFTNCASYWFPLSSSLLSSIWTSFGVCIKPDFSFFLISSDRGMAHKRQTKWGGLLHVGVLVKQLPFAPVCEAMPYDVKGGEQLDCDVGELPFSLSVLTQAVCRIRGSSVLWFVWWVVVRSQVSPVTSAPWRCFLFVSHYSRHPSTLVFTGDID